MSEYQEEPDAEVNLTDNVSQRPKCFSSTFQEIMFVLTATMAIGQQSFFQGCTVGVTASIGSNLHMSSAEITWINAGASLTSGAFLLTFGKLADMFGRKILFILGMAGFTFSHLIAGFATNPIYMDVFSGIIGLFAAAVVPPAVGALGATYEKPSKRKNLAFACFSAGNPLGFVGGMIISGVAAHLYSWRASFWALAVVYSVFTVLTVWTVPMDGFERRRRRRVSLEALRECDFLGMGLVVVGFAFFTSSLSLAGDAPHGWKTGYVLGLFIVGLLLLGCFLYWQSVAKYPLMPLWVWRDRNFSLLIGICCSGFMGFSAVTFYLSLFLQEVKHLSALEITVRLLPMVIGGVLVNVVCGLILHRVSNKILTGIGALAYTASFLILSFMGQDSIYWAFMFPALTLMVVGADIQFNVTNMYVMSTLPPSQQSIAGGIFNTVIKLCNNLGLGIATSVQSSVLHRVSASSPAIRPYLSAFWFAAAVAGVSMFMVPFLTIDKQGNTVRESDAEETTSEKKDVLVTSTTVVSPGVEITEPVGR